jgi:hypothetical protein
MQPIPPEAGPPPAPSATYAGAVPYQSPGYTDPYAQPGYGDPYSPRYTTDPYAPAYPGQPGDPWQSSYPQYPYADPFAAAPPKSTAMMDGGHSLETAREALAWRKSPEWRRIVLVALTAAALILASGIVLTTTGMPRRNGLLDATVLRLGAALVTAVVAAAGLLWWWRSHSRLLFRYRYRLERAAEIEQAEGHETVPVAASESAGQRRWPTKPEQESPNIATELRSLYAATQIRIDSYHKMATMQARVSFRNAQAATAAGFSILCLAVGAALFTTSTTGAITIGSLGITGSVLAAYISRTFVRAQENTSARLQTYFAEPFELSRVLAARLLINEIAEQTERESAIGVIATAIVTSPNDSTKERS